MGSPGTGDYTVKCGPVTEGSSEPLPRRAPSGLLGSQNPRGGRHQGVWPPFCLTHPPHTRDSLSFCFQALGASRWQAPWPTLGPIPPGLLVR